MRIDGDHGDKLSLSGNWTAIDPSNGPDGFDVFACHAPTGSGNVYALVQEDIAVTIAAYRLSRRRRASRRGTR